jgi:streptogramin lyase
MRDRRIDSPRPDQQQRRRESMKRRIEVEGLEIRQLMASQVLSEYPLAPSTSPAKIALAPDGSLWFSENGATPAALGRVTTSGQVSQAVALSAGDSTFGLTLGPDNNFWTTEQGASPAIAQVVPLASGATYTEFTNFANPGASHNPNSISKGPQGDSSYVWFTDSGTANAIGRVAVNGAPNQVIQEFPLAADRIVGSEITPGPAGDNGLYFLQTASGGSQSFIGRIDDTTGAITEFPVANPDGLAPGTPTGLVAGPGDAIYFTEQNTGRIGQLNLATGVVNDDFYTIPDVNGAPVGPTAIALFPDGNLYVTETNVGGIAKLDLDSTGAVTGFFQYSTFPSVNGALPGIAADQAGNPWFTESGTSRIGTFTIPNAPLQAQPATINGIVNQPLANVPIATFTDPDGPSPSTEYRATIDWGDGSALDSNTTFNPIGTSGSFQILGSHTYGTAGKFTPTVTISDLASPRTATVFDSASISVSPVGPAASDKATAGTPLLGAVLATFPVQPGDYSATIDWGDGSAQGGATIIPTPIAMTDAVTDTHTFAEPGTFNGSITLHNPDGSLTVFPLQSIVSGLTTGPVVPVALKSGIAGTPFQPFMPLVALTPTPGSPNPDPADYSATIDWGDGSPSTIARVVGNGTALQILTDSHTYDAPGTYTIHYALGDAGAPNLATGTVSAEIFDLPGTPVAQSGVIGMPIDKGGPIPLLTVDSVPAAQAGDYSATIDYGDGSPTSVGTLMPVANGGFTVDGPTHVYQAPGDYHVNILIGTAGQPNLATFSTTITVTEPPIAINGMLNPTSDTGTSNSDGITKDVTPNFLGATAPDATVRLYTIPAANPSATPTLIGLGVANSISGAYSITSSPLADGTYDVEAIATSEFGTQTGTVFLESGMHPLVIDTAGPKITGFAVSNTVKGQFQVTFQDNLSGLDVYDLVNGANYSVQRPVPTPRPGQNFIVSSLSATPETTPTTPVTVTGSVFNGHYLVLRGGEFIFTINGSGITDVAGNALQGQFYGTFPTGDGHAGTNFKAEVIIRQYTPSGPIPFTTAKPSHPGTAAVSPTTLAPKLKKPGLNAPPTSLPGVNTGQELSSTSTHKKVVAKHAKAKPAAVKHHKA